jgi:hypothetical protein
MNQREGHEWVVPGEKLQLLSVAVVQLLGTLCRLEIYPDRFHRLALTDLPESLGRGPEDLHVPPRLESIDEGRDGGPVP